ncbi:MAG: N(4)-(beta-N-acetylglucosaminyl)-L-asparaginase [bacterium]|nr:N(4)-(beta-N-acetylglucosaminyl)-L-asparaginase [bacterium]
MKPIVVSTWSFGERANVPAWEILKNGGSAMDAVVAGVAVAERDPEVKSVGYGGYPNSEGVVEVDAAVVDGRTLGYGAVAGVQRIVTPAAVARAVMEKTDHVLLVGEGALAFARSLKFEEKDLLTDRAREAWEEWKAGRAEKPKDAHDTIGMIALDASGNLAAACTTSGVAFKLPGRVGDSPLIGSGLYADNEVGAATATGQGEEIARVCGSFLIVELMRQGRSPQEACEETVQRLIQRVPTSRPYQMAFAAINKDGAYGGAAARSGFSYAVTGPEENRLYEGRFFIQD